MRLLLSFLKASLHQVPTLTFVVFLFALLFFYVQNASSVQYGRIIDPYAGMEIQYSTPTFSFAGATVVASKYACCPSSCPAYKDLSFASSLFRQLCRFYNASATASLLADVSLAVTAALKSLVFGQPVGDEGCAQGHCNFYTMPLMLGQ